MVPDPLTNRLYRVFSNKNLNRVSVCIVITGILLRLALYFQNRSLILDEANVVRNIYERSYIRLLAPLDYEQFAPPSFLWVSKTMSVLFGFSEYAMRIYPLLCSIISLWVFRILLKELISEKAAMLYPLLLMASGFIFIRYATEVKQYSADITVTLAVILFSLKTDILQTRPLAFFIIWAIAGSIAIWFSMPSIFILAGVFSYYSYTLFRQERSKLIMLAGIGTVWASQFLLYYLAILKPEINCDYLKATHEGYFITLLPHSLEEITHNAQLCLDIVGATGGITVLAIAFHSLLIFTGAILLYRKFTARFFLFAIPFVCLYLAAAFHQFTLMPRVVLFSMPLLLLLTGIGIDCVLSYKFKVLKLSLLIIAVICLVNFNQYKYLFHPYKHEEFKEGLSIVQQEHIKGAHFHINFLMVPVYLYYTTINPEKDKWRDLWGADKTTWRTNYDSLAQTFQREAFIYVGYDDRLLNAEIDIDHKYCRHVSERKFPGGEVFILEK